MVYVHQVIPAVVLCFMGFMFASVETYDNMMGVEMIPELATGFSYMGIGIMLSGVGYLAICMIRTWNDEDVVNGRNMHVQCYKDYIKRKENKK